MPIQLITLHIVFAAFWWHAKNKCHPSFPHDHRCSTHIPTPFVAPSSCTSLPTAAVTSENFSPGVLFKYELQNSVVTVEYSLSHCKLTYFFVKKLNVELFVCFPTDLPRSLRIDFFLQHTLPKVRHIFNVFVLFLLLAKIVSRVFMRKSDFILFTSCCFSLLASLIGCSLLNGLRKVSVMVRN